MHSWLMLGGSTVPLGKELPMRMATSWRAEGGARTSLGGSVMMTAWGRGGRLQAFPALQLLASFALC